jgi:hypothetical protein
MASGLFNVSQIVGIDKVGFRLSTWTLQLHVGHQITSNRTRVWQAASVGTWPDELYQECQCRQSDREVT